GRSGRSGPRPGAGEDGRGLATIGARVPSKSTATRARDGALKSVSSAVRPASVLGRNRDMKDLSGRATRPAESHVCRWVGARTGVHGPLEAKGTGNRSELDSQSSGVALPLSVGA